MFYRAVSPNVAYTAAELKQLRAIHASCREYCSPCRFLAAIAETSKEIKEVVDGLGSLQKQGEDILSQESPLVGPRADRSGFSPSLDSNHEPDESAEDGLLGTR